MGSAFAKQEGDTYTCNDANQLVYVAEDEKVTCSSGRKECVIEEPFSHGFKEKNKKCYTSLEYSIRYDGITEPTIPLPLKASPVEHGANKAQYSLVPGKDKLSSLACFYNASDAKSKNERLIAFSVGVSGGDRCKFYDGGKDITPKLGYTAGCTTGPCQLRCGSSASPAHSHH